ncbi:MAG: transposase [Pseudonocardiaceae bacterium]
MRATRVWRRVLGVEHTVIESVDLEADGWGGEVLVARVRVKAGAARRCSRCQRRCLGYDASAKPRRWRGQDLDATRVFLQASTCRVSCPEHGVVVAALPWARPGSRFTMAFEDTCAWLVCHATLSVVAILLRVAWRSGSDIVTRVVAQRAGQVDRLAGLRRIGIDEISYRKGQRFLLVVVDHDTGRLVWAGKDRNQQTLGRFFDDLGAERAAGADPRLGRRRGVDPRCGHRTGTPSRAVSRRLSRRGLGHQGTGCGPSRHGQPAACQRPDRRGHSAQGQPVGAAEKPPEPHR